jgi:type I restriction enzyme R subunit
MMKLGIRDSHSMTGSRRRVGVEELEQNKLTPLLKLKYHDSINDAIADLGNADHIGKAFTGFQKYLYQEAA